DGGEGLLLHGEDPRGLVADLAPGIVELAEDVLIGEHAQPDLAALAQVRAFQVVVVAGLGVERDDRARSEVERFEVPFVADLLVLDWAWLPRLLLGRGWLPERQRHVLR